MIKRLLDNKLKENNIDIAYEYAILKNTDPTTIQSKRFEASLVPTIGVPIFLDENEESEYGLYINFPSRKRFIMSSIIGMTSLSILFTIIIIRLTIILTIRCTNTCLTCYWITITHT